MVHWVVERCEGGRRDRRGQHVEDPGCAWRPGPRKRQRWARKHRHCCAQNPLTVWTPHELISNYPGYDTAFLDGFGASVVPLGAVVPVLRYGLRWPFAVGSCFWSLRDRGAVSFDHAPRNRGSAAQVAEASNPEGLRRHRAVHSRKRHRASDNPSRGLPVRKGPIRDPPPWVRSFVSTGCAFGSNPSVDARLPWLWEVGKPLSGAVPSSWRSHAS